MICPFCLADPDIDLATQGGCIGYICVLYDQDRDMCTLETLKYAVSAMVECVSKIGAILDTLLSIKALIMDNEVFRSTKATNMNMEDKP